MSATVQRLTQLVEDLKESGEAPVRLAAARCALAFKRSWIELAAAIVAVNKGEAYTAWGYGSLVEYCTSELGIRGATVDKLLVSYATLRKHAPEHIEGASAAPIPSYEALDYYARVAGEPRADGSVPRNAPKEEPSEEVMSQLHEAVFEEGQSAQKLRQQFDPIVRPRSPDEQQLMALRRAAATAQRLLDQLADVDGLDDIQVRQMKNVIESLRGQITTLVKELRGDEGEARAG